MGAERCVYPPLELPFRHCWATAGRGACSNVLDIHQDTLNTLIIMLHCACCTGCSTPIKQHGTQPVAEPEEALRQGRQKQGVSAQGQSRAGSAGGSGSAGKSFACGRGQACTVGTSECVHLVGVLSSRSPCRLGVEGLARLAPASGQHDRLAASAGASTTAP